MGNYTIKLMIYRNLRSDVSGRGLLGLTQYVLLLGLDGDGQVAEDLGVIGKGDVEIGTILWG